MSLFFKKTKESEAKIEHAIVLNGLSFEVGHVVCIKTKDKKSFVGKISDITFKGELSKERTISWKIEIDVSEQYRANIQIIELDEIVAIARLRKISS